MVRDNKSYWAGSSLEAVSVAKGWVHKITSLPWVLPWKWCLVALEVLNLDTWLLNVILWS